MKLENSVNIIAQKSRARLTLVAFKKRNSLSRIFY